MGLGYVLVEDGLISEIGLGNPMIPDSEEIDAGGRYISPGFIDLHTHGGGNHDFMDGTIEAFLGASRMHGLHGTTLLYPTTLTSTTALLYETFELYRTVKDLPLEGSAFGGLHLEGPYFSESQRGAQDIRYLRLPEAEEYMEILERGEGLISRWSLAPELPGSLSLGIELQKRGILAGIAHTNALYEEVESAFEHGFRLLVHFYSCMSTITRRNAMRYAGVIESGYGIDEMNIELIGDGIHVPPSLLRIAYSMKGAEHIVLVTDSMRAAGMPENRTYLLGSLKDGQMIKVQDGVAKLMDESAFGGSVATMDRCVRTMYRQGEVRLEDAVRMATSTPARLMGIFDRKGSLLRGKDADIVIFDDNITVFMTMVKGHIVYKK